MRPHPDSPFAVSYGLGVDSTALLVGLAEQGIRPDIITFADTGDEKPETYAYLPVMNAWLESVGFPLVTVCRYQPVRATYHTLGENCRQNATLPSLAFGRKACSLKFKVAVQHQELKGYTATGLRPAHAGFQPALDAWARGGRVLRAIGYDAGAKDSKRSHNLTDDELYAYWYPLRDWGWNRADSAAAIRGVGLPVPVKSACYYCPASKPEELVWLAYHHPDLFTLALEMEDNAQPNLLSIEGLWRTTRKGDGRSGSWRIWAQDQGLVVGLDDDPHGPFRIADHVLNAAPDQMPVHPDAELILLESEMIHLPQLA